MASTFRESLGQVLFVVMPVIHLQLVSTALMGIYDPIAVLAVVASAALLYQRKPVGALLAVSGALFFHFRALWQLPLLVVVIVQVYRGRAAWWGSRRARAMVALAAMLLLVSGVCFLTVMPALNSFRIDNRYHLAAMHFSVGYFIRDWLIVCGLLGALLFQRHWMTMALAAWQLVMLVQTRQMQIWHPTFFLPIFAVAAHERKGAAQAINVVFLLFIWENWQVYSTWVLSGKRLAEYVGL